MLQQLKYPSFSLHMINLSSSNHYMFSTFRTKPITNHFTRFNNTLTKPYTTTSIRMSAQNERGQGVSHAKDSQVPGKAQEAVRLPSFLTLYHLLDANSC